VLSWIHFIIYHFSILIVFSSKHMLRDEKNVQTNFGSFGVGRTCIQNPGLYWYFGIASPSIIETYAIFVLSRYV